MNEEWKPVSNTNSEYLVSNFGGLISRKSGSDYKLSKKLGTDGYWYIDLRVDNKYVYWKVARLVASEFCDGYREGLIVNHKDGNKLNDRADNLEWVTYSENNQHAYDTGLRSSADHNGSKNPNSVLTSTDVREIIRLYLEERFSIQKLANIYGLAYQPIWKIIKGKNWLTVTEGKDLSRNNKGVFVDDHGRIISRTIERAK